jgi:hypothetical protein
MNKRPETNTSLFAPIYQDKVDKRVQVCVVLVCLSILKYADFIDRVFKQLVSPVYEGRLPFSLTVLIRQEVSERS